MGRSLSPLVAAGLAAALVGAATAPAAAPGRASGRTLLLTAAEVRDLLLAPWRADERGAKALSAVRDVEVALADERLEVAARLNLASLPPDLFEEGQRETYETILRVFPFLGWQEVPVALGGRPAASGGGLRFDGDATVRVGFLDLTVAQIGTLLGLEEADLARGFELPLGTLHVLDAAVVGDRLRIVTTDS